MDWYDYRLNIFALIGAAAALGSGALLGSKFEIVIGVICIILAIATPADHGEEK